jgi:hypothetical protein
MQLPQWLEPIPCAGRQEIGEALQAIFCGGREFSKPGRDSFRRTTAAVRSRAEPFSITANHTHVMNACSCCEAAHMQ